LIFIVVVAAFRIFRNRWKILRYPRTLFNDLRLRGLAVTLSVTIGVFAATQIAFESINLFVYGKFVGVDVKEENFKRALRAIDSVRSGGTKPFIPITYAAMKRVDAVSPAFASLAPYFDGPGKGWVDLGCRFIPDLCGEIGGDGSCGRFAMPLRRRDITHHRRKRRRSSAASLTKCRLRSRRARVPASIDCRNAPDKLARRLGTLAASFNGRI
jgi:hypothetical protein